MQIKRTECSTEKQNLLTTKKTIPDKSTSVNEILKSFMAIDKLIMQQSTVSTLIPIQDVRREFEPIMGDYATREQNSTDGNQNEPPDPGNIKNYGEIMEDVQHELEQPRTTFGNSDTMETVQMEQNPTSQ